MRESCLVYCYSRIQSLFEVVLLYTFYTHYNATCDVWISFCACRFSDLNTVVQHTLNNPVHARFIRFYPATFAYFPCMRVEVFAQ